MSRVVELLIDEEEEFSGVEAVSLVEYPAIEEDWIFLSKGSKRMFATDDEQRMLIGPALIPDKRIPRVDEEGEYEVYFSKGTVKKAQELFMKEARNNSSTFEHQYAIDGVSVIESWIIEDKSKDKSKLYGFSLPTGTWMIGVKVYNDEVWADVKDKAVKGFSIEGYFTDKLIQASAQEGVAEIVEEALKPSYLIDETAAYESFNSARLMADIKNSTVGTVKVNGKVYFTVK